MKIADLPSQIVSDIRRGVVIPAMPLALDSDKNFDKVHQKALLRYYVDAGAGGVAVGVHSTQFEIRDPEVGLFEEVLKFASETLDSYCAKQNKNVAKIAGVCGKTKQALAESAFALSCGYQACLLSLAAFKKEDDDVIIDHCKQIAEVMPLIGFYLQPAVGGRILSCDFWRKFAQIENVLAIKMAPFNRYQTLDVVRAVCDAGRENDIALYTGNDDNILIDLLTEYNIVTANGPRKARIVGGLLGHWAVWTQKAVELLSKAHEIVDQGGDIPLEMLSLANEITDTNAVFFDAANGFSGCIPGIHEVLRRQGLFAGTWCLNPDELLSPGQKEEIDRVYMSYPHLCDDDFVKRNLANWLND